MAALERGRRYRRAPPKCPPLVTVLVVAAAVGAVMIVGIPLLLAGLTRLLKVFHISSRSLQMFLSGKLTAGNGREKIWEIAEGMLKENFLTGYGFYGDRYVIGRTWAYGYPHNIAYEMWIQFGIPLGMAILGFIGYKVIKMLFTCKDASWFLLLSLMFSCSMKLALSDSFWYYWPFWGMIAILINWKFERRKEKTAHEE